MNTYRVRLTIAIMLLMAFLTATLSYSYIYSRDVILDEAETSVRNSGKLLSASMAQEIGELLHYANVVRDDLRIREYMFMTVSIGTDSEALMQLFQRQFEWLPASYRLIVSNKGQILADEGYPALANALIEQLKRSPEHQTFFFQDERGLQMVTWAAVDYEGVPLGAVALARSLDVPWLDQHRHYSKGHLFIERDGKIYLSTLADSKGAAFSPESGRASLNGEAFRVVPVSLSGFGHDAPRLWHGVSEEKLLEQLEVYSRQILSLALAGCLAILFLGLFILRDFSRPLSELMKKTQAVADGILPQMDKSKANNEIGVLANQFSEMLQALREKQDEIDNVHQQLKQSAITDSLTQLYNRRHLDESFPKLLAQARRNGHYLWGMLLDLDYFKKINDRYGHLAGDQCLRHFSALLSDNCRANDYAFRMGGEEFFLLTVDDTEHGGVILAEKIRTALEHSLFEYDGQQIHVTTSIGVACADKDIATDKALRRLLLECDNLMYQAKQDGRNCTRRLSDAECCIPPQSAGGGGSTCR